MEESNPELESFRQQWKAEVIAKSTASGSREPTPTTAASGPSSRPPAAPRIAGNRAGEDHGHFAQYYHDLDGVGDTAEPRNGESSKDVEIQPQSALEHYELAVEKESQGNLGESLNLYRKALRMDPQVDKKYKNKHFPPSSFVTSKSLNTNPSNAPVTVPNPAHASLDGHPQSSLKELIAGFANLIIEPTPPAIEGTPAPICPIAELPQELLIQIFRNVAIIDIASFVKLARVCKRMAYLVMTEEQIWKRVCEGSEVGFGAMHYEWQQQILGEPLEIEFPEIKEDSEQLEVAQPIRDTITEALFHSVYQESWLQMFKLRPRIRFNGCYISTNNYIRPGQGSTNLATWINPVHIVTYYRYVRFFRDGTLISLLTTTDPIHVVRYLTKDFMTTHANSTNLHLPSAVMQHGLRGRWRLSPVNENLDADLKDAEGDLCVETEGVGPKYVYRMDLSLRSSSKGAKNNKLVWRGFWSHNKLTDDWAKFSRRNEKPLYWSRVRSYGTGT